ncbi:hypothetical protein D3C81_365230 [compost metagenome]
MDEILKAVTGALIESPTLALWVLVIIYGFKVVVVGSVYGTIRFVIDRMHSAYLAPKHERKIIDIEYKLKEMSITNPDAVIAQLERVLRRLPGKRHLGYEDINWLSDAISDKEAKDAAKKSTTKVG